MTERLRVGLVTYALEAGGMETTLVRQAKALAAAGHEVEVVTTVQEGAWAEQVRRQGLLVRHVRATWPQRPLGVPNALRVARFVRERRYDALFLHHAPYLQATLGLLPDRVLAFPVLHNDLAPIYRVGCGNARAWNAAVAVGPKVAAEARRRCPDRPVVEIRNGVEVPGREGHGHASPLEVLFVGRLAHEQKGVLLLPAIVAGAATAGARISLTVVGDGPDRAALEQGLAAAGVEARLTGLLPPAEVARLLARAHVLLLPSFYEGLPVVPLEAQGAGCVVVASRLPGITDVAVADGSSGLLVPPGEPAGYRRSRRVVA